MTYFIYTSTFNYFIENWVGFEHVTFEFRGGSFTAAPNITYPFWLYQIEKKIKVFLFKSKIRIFLVFLFLVLVFKFCNEVIIEL